MPRLIAYLCNDDSLTPVALRAMQGSLELPPTAESGGFGLGWLQDGRSLLRTTPKPAPSSPALLDLMSDIRARALIGYVRDVSDGTVDTLNLQPFRMRRWVFAHGGEEAELAQTHQQLLGDVAKFVAGNIKGTSSAEVFGHVFLGELHARNLLDSAPDAAGQCANALATAIRKIQIGAAIADLGAIAVSDRMLIAGAVGHPLHYREMRGLSQMKEEPLFAGHKPKPTSHPTFKAVFVTDGPTMGDEWKVVPDGHVMWLDRDWTVKFAPIAE